MKLVRTLMLTAVAAIAVAALSGCASSSGAEHSKHHPKGSAAGQQMGMAGKQGMMMKDADMKAMCDMHMAMMQADSPAERQAMMAEHMKNMPPEMMKQHMEMMGMQMQMMREHMGMRGR